MGCDFTLYILGNIYISCVLPIYIFSNRQYMPKQSSTVIKFICAALRGAPQNWPDSPSPSFKENLLLFSKKQGLQSLLASSIHNSTYRGNYPEDVKSTLKANAKRFAAIDMILGHELIQVLDALSDDRIYPLLMKGTPLTYTHYPNLGTRPRCDTDMLILVKDIDTFFCVMQKLGYTYNPVDDLSSRQISFSKKCSMNVTHTLDVHWRINNRLLFFKTLTYEELNQEAIAIPALGTHAHSLCPVHALLLACLHRAAHGSTGDEEMLLWLYDIHLLVSRFSKVEFLYFASLAENKRLKAICLDALKSSNKLYNTTIPAIVLSELSKATSHEPSARFLESNAPRFLAKDIIAVSGTHHILSGIIEILFPPSTYVLNNYRISHKILLPMLYLHRLILGLKGFLITYKLQLNS